MPSLSTSAQRCVRCGLFLYPMWMLCGCLLCLIYFLFFFNFSPDVDAVRMPSLSTSAQRCVRCGCYVHSVFLQMWLSMWMPSPPTFIHVRVILAQRCVRCGCLCGCLPHLLSFTCALYWRSGV
ncbi:hypothetical protein [Crucivirus-389]|nr:hypothetical protein [Crucivirus-389]